MPRFKWIYLEGAGVKHHVELFHGRMKGHVLISCNGSILVTDFDVRQNKTYTFFINNELCKIHLKRKGLKFTYSFEIDKITDTPLNQIRRARQNRYNVYLGLLVLFFGLVCTAFIFFNRKVQKDRKGIDPRLVYTHKQSSSILPPAQIYYGSIIEEGDELFIQSTIDSKHYVLELDNTIASNGWPIEHGQKYQVNLFKDELIIQWQSPSDETLSSFRARALAKLDHRGLELLGYKNRDCLEELVLRYTTAYGLASFAFADLDKADNAYANNQSYVLILQSKEMQDTYNQICTDSL